MQEIIIYDNNCGFCEWCREVVESHDPNNRYHFVGLDSTIARDIFDTIDQDIHTLGQETFILYVPHAGTWFSHAQALEEICKHCRLPLTLIYYLLRISPRFVGDWAYRQLAIHRPLLGKLVRKKTCRISK